MEYVVIVEFLVFPIHRKAFYDLLVWEAKAMTEKEKGTLHVTTMLDDGDPNRFVNIEIYASKDDFAKHNKGKICQEFFQKGDSMISRGAVILFEGPRLASGNAFSFDAVAPGKKNTDFRR